MAQGIEKAPWRGGLFRWTEHPSWSNWRLAWRPFPPPLPAVFFTPVAASRLRRVFILRDIGRRTRLAKCGYRQERYSSHRFAKAPTAALYDRDLPEGALMVFALIGQRSIARKGREWVSGWCQLPPTEIARQLKVSVPLVRAALASRYVEVSDQGVRVLCADQAGRWCPLPFGPLGDADDAPALTPREYLILAVGLHRELAGAPALDCEALAALTRTCSGRCVSPATVAKTLKSMAQRGWDARDLVGPMRADTSSHAFSSSIPQHIPANAQVEAPMPQIPAKPLDNTLDSSISPRSVSSRSQGGCGGSVRTAGAVRVTRPRGERGISPRDRADVAAVRDAFGGIIGGKVAASGMGRCANEWIAREIDTGVPVERLIYRVSGAVLRLDVGELYMGDGIDGLVRFVRFALRRPSGCGDLGCEDGLLWDYERRIAGDACTACRERRLALAERKRAPESEPERFKASIAGHSGGQRCEERSMAPRARAKCRECEVPFRDGVGPAGGICRSCRG